MTSPRYDTHGVRKASAATATVVYVAALILGFGFYIGVAIWLATVVSR